MDHSFRGAVVRHESVKPIRLGRCDVSDERLVLVNPRGDEFIVKREQARAVTVDRQRGPFNWRTVVRFDSGSTPFAVIFVPLRARRFIAALRELDWPVVEHVAPNCPLWRRVIPVIA